MFVFLKKVLTSKRFDSWKRLPLCIVTSRKSTESWLISWVYLRVGWCWFSLWRKDSRVSFVSVQIVNISSMYLFQMRGLIGWVLRKFCSMLCMKVFAYEGAIFVPMAVPCICL